MSLGVFNCNYTLIANSSRNKSISSSKLLIVHSLTANQYHKAAITLKVHEHFMPV